MNLVLLFYNGMGAGRGEEFSKDILRLLLKMYLIKQSFIMIFFSQYGLSML